MRNNKVTYAHLNALRKVFLDIDESGDRKGLISKHDFLVKILEEGFQFPLDFLINILSDIQVDPNDRSENALVSYDNVKTVIDVFSMSPSFQK